MLKIVILICIAVCSFLLVECYLLEDKLERMQNLNGEILKGVTNILEEEVKTIKAHEDMLKQISEEQIRIGNAVAKASIDTGKNSRQISDLKTAVRKLNDSYAE